MLDEFVFACTCHFHKHPQTTRFLFARMQARFFLWFYVLTPPNIAKMAFVSPQLKEQIQILAFAAACQKLHVLPRCLIDSNCITLASLLIGFGS